MSLSRHMVPLVLDGRLAIACPWARRQAATKTLAVFQPESAYTN